MIKRITTLGLFITITIVMSCHSSKAEDDTKAVSYWTAPSLELSRFESKMVEEWNLRHSDSIIDWKTIPAGTTSEEVLLTAIATRTGPDICSNIFGLVRVLIFALIYLVVLLLNWLMQKS